MLKEATRALKCAKRQLKVAEGAQKSVKEALNTFTDMSSGASTLTAQSVETAANKAYDSWNKLWETAAKTKVEISLSALVIVRAYR